MRKNIFVGLFFLLTPILYSQTISDSVTAKITNYLASRIQHDGPRPVHNLLVYYEDPEYTYYHAVGLADGASVPVEKDFQFKIASVTKTFTATVILQMAEEGLLELDDPMYQYVSDYDFIHIDRIHPFNGRSYGRKVTIKQLLQHRSGIADMFFDKYEEFMNYFENHRQKQWAPEALFEYFYAHEINKLAHFPPGEGFHYSDVNYFLLGLIIEQVSGAPLPAQIRKRILEPLHMQNTYFEYYEPIRGHQNMAHAFMGPEDITLTANTSFDWSGGGLVSTVKDLSVFLQRLMEGNLFQDPATLVAMKQMHDAGNYPFDYGMGLIGFHFNGELYYGHSGFWGVVMAHHPGENRTICLAFNQASPPFNYMQVVSEILSIIR